MYLVYILKSDNYSYVGMTNISLNDGDNIIKKSKEVLSIQVKEVNGILFVL